MIFATQNDELPHCTVDPLVWRRGHKYF